jgi:hypothetical protein
LNGYKEAWKIDQQTGIASTVILKQKIIDAADKRIVYKGKWKQELVYVKSSDEKDASFSFTVKATQIGIYALAQPEGGYASIIIQNSKGKIVLAANIDFYSKYLAMPLKFMSPVMKKDNYTVTVKVLGEKWWWKEKSGRLSGSKGHYVSINSVVVVE